MNRLASTLFGLGRVVMLLGTVLLVLALAPAARAESPRRQVAGRAYLLYRLAMQGDVGGNSFQRSAELFITEPLMQGGTAPVNAYDVLLLSGQPVTTPELGAINFASNTFFFGRNSAQTAPTLDLARVALNTKGTGLAVQTLPGVTGTVFRNTFNPRPWWFGNVYEVNSGTMQIELSGDSQTVSGQITATGTGFIFFLSTPYHATFTGTLIDQGEF